MQFIDCQNWIFIFFVIEYYVLNPLFGLFFLFLNSLNFILNHSSISIPSMHHRNFLFSCGFLMQYCTRVKLPPPNKNLLTQIYLPEYCLSPRHCLLMDWSGWSTNECFEIVRFCKMKIDVFSQLCDDSFYVFFFMAYLSSVSGISDDNRIQTEPSFSTSIISQEDILSLVFR